MPPTRYVRLGNRQLCLLLLLALIVCAARAPKELLNGQVYAEEGTTYLRFAWNARPVDALFAPHEGYYSLLNNIATFIAARLLPLSLAAWLFVWTALAVRLLVAYLIITSEYLTSLPGRMLALCAFLLGIGTLEGWLNLEYSQFLSPSCRGPYPRLQRRSLALLCFKGSKSRSTPSCWSDGCHELCLTPALLVESGASENKRLLY